MGRSLEGRLDPFLQADEVNDCDGLEATLQSVLDTFFFVLYGIFWISSTSPFVDIYNYFTAFWTTIGDILMWANNRRFLLIYSI